MSHGITWNDEQKNELRRLMAQGDMSFAQMAAELSVKFSVILSRNAAIGMAGRLGLKHAAPPRPIKFRPKPRSRPSTPIKPPPPDDGNVVSLHLALLDLGPGQCRFPHGDGAPYTFCGRPAMFEGSYCARHHRQTHVIGSSWEREVTAPHE